MSAHPPPVPPANDPANNPAAEPHPSRRRFLTSSGVVAAAVWPGVAGATPGPVPPEATPPGVDSDEADGITPGSIAEAEKLAGVSFTHAERVVIAEDVGDFPARYERRRRDAPLVNADAPAQVLVPSGPSHAPAADRLVLTPPTASPPRREADLLYAPIGHLAGWMERGDITSETLTRVSLRRLRQLGPALECVVTRTERLALEQARRADRARVEGEPTRGPLHGVPWGAKDLLDTAGERTTWGARPFQHRVATGDAAVVRRLADAGAVLTAKLTLGALAYGDIWFGGKTRNPWKPTQGSSGSSAGSAAAVAAGLVSFAIGTETLGSIVSPCMRCGTTGLRPTFGRVPRSGAMSLCWSMDKIGPIGRSVEDCAAVLATLNGADDGDAASRSHPFAFDAGVPAAGRRVGYHPSWFESAPAIDQRVLEVARRVGLELVEVDLPEWPYETLLTILYAEAATAFDELTLEDRDDELEWQAPEAWPNSFRQARFIPAIEYLQADRFRRKVAAMMAERFQDVDAIISPSYAASLLLITNCTGHPSLTIRAGFRDDDTPRGITLWGRLFDEGTLLTIGAALERELDVANRRPPGFE
ncbi:MAG: amidase [Phycisphaerales bacterium]|nr:amidase [Phycisphaerales bacterium]